MVSVNDHQVGGRLAQTGRKGSTMFFSPSFLFLPARGKTKAEGRVWVPSQGQEAMYFGDLSCFLDEQVEIMNKEKYLPDTGDARPKERRLNVTNFGLIKPLSFRNSDWLSKEQESLLTAPKPKTPRPFVISLTWYKSTC